MKRFVIGLHPAGAEQQLTELADFMRNGLLHDNIALGQLAHAARLFAKVAEAQECAELAEAELTIFLVDEDDMGLMATLEVVGVPVTVLQGPADVEDAA